MSAARAKLTILSGATVSNTLADIWSANAAKVALENAEGITIQSPGTLTGAMTIEVTQDGTDWATLQDDAADLVPAAGKAVTLPLGVSGIDLRLVSGTAEAADRDFYVSLSMDD